ncbi:MAG: leucyl aminopeptidase family protein [Candidatus Caenarcaniphilales bacterium]|nr:leucyl aminopeptidase family protein [Candidatus Caenarcaniphilales bacterium]
MKKTANWALLASKEYEYGELLIQHQKEKDQNALIVGIGKEKLSVSRLRKVIHKSINFLKSQNVKITETNFSTETEIEEQIVLLALLEANYSFNKYRKSSVKEIDFSPLLKNSKNKELQILLESIQLTKDLVNEPPNLMTPEILAKFCKNLTSEIPNLKVKILNESQIHKIGMGAFLSVAQASDNRPYLIEFNYNPQRKSKKRIGLIGKGLTYDTGGLSLKPNNYMYGMKSDMAGAATVIGIINAAAKLRLQVPLTGLILACENSFSERSFKPGDVIKALSGKTIEVVDTDAEGRLTLADALTYLSKREEIDTIIDYATLTGSCVYTLGIVASGGFTNDAETIEKFKEASELTGENVWELPIFEEYRSNLDSSIADILQCDGRPDASMAAIFLKEFLVNEKKWLHLDIAGTAYLDEDDGFHKAGATGRGVWSTIEFLKAL